MKIILLLGCFLFPGALTWGLDIDQTYVAGQQKALAEFYPCSEGSASEKKILELLENELKELEIDHQTHPLDKQHDSHSFSCFVEADVTGLRPETLIIAIPVNQTTERDQQGQDPINMALGLGILKAARQAPPSVSLKVLFLGAETGSGPQYPFGSRAFLDYYSPEHPTAVFYLNLTDSNKTIYLEYINNSELAPLWFLQKTITGLRKSGAPFTVKDSLRGPVFSSQNQSKRLVDIYGQNDFVFIELASVNQKTLNKKDAKVNSTQQIALFFKEFLILNKNGLPETEERHYLFFKLLDNYYFIGEHSYLIIFIVITALLLLYPFIAYRRFLRYAYILIRHIGTIPLLVLVIALFLAAGTSVVWLVLKLSGYSDFWKINSLWFYALKINFSLLLFSLSHNWLRKLPHARRGNFYAAAMLLLLTVDLLILIFIDIAMTYVILWMLVFAFGFSAARKRNLKILFMVLTFSLPLTVIFNILSSADSTMSRFLLLSPYKGNILQACLLLPFLFMIMRLRFLFYISSRQKKRWYAFLNIFLAATCLACFIGLLRNNPHNQDYPQPVKIEHVNDYEQGAGLRRATSPGPLPDSSLKDFGFKDSYEEAQDLPEPLIDHTIAVREFLNRKEIFVRVINKNSTNLDNQINFKLLTGHETIIYNCNFPYSINPETGAVNLHIGLNPPPLVTIDLVLSADRPINSRLTYLQFEKPRQKQVDGNYYLIKKQIRNDFSLLLAEPDKVEADSD